MMIAHLRERFLTRPIEPVALDRPVSLWDLPTPALVVDQAAMERNLRKMASFFAMKRGKLRPHVKTHKSPLIARRQMELGAVGLCAAKVSEAEVLFSAGLNRILITSPVVSPEKIERVIRLAKHSSEIAIVVDQAANARDFDQAAGAAGIRLSVLIDLDEGMHRTGVALGQPALDLAREIQSCRNLRLQGIQAYAGRLMHRKGFDDRKKAYLETMARVVETKNLIEQAGIELPIMTGGGTGTYNVDSEIESVTDVQAGSYIFMDAEYRAVGGTGGPIFDDFEPSLFVLATAISQPAKGMITLDSGFKTISADANNLPVPRDVTGTQFFWGGDEHGILLLAAPSREIKVGDKLLLIVSHSDPTVNLHDFYFPFLDEKVSELWPISARGCSQ